MAANKTILKKDEVFLESIKHLRPDDQELMLKRREMEVLIYEMTSKRYRIKTLSLKEAIPLMREIINAGHKINRAPEGDE